MTASRRLRARAAAIVASLLVGSLLSMGTAQATTITLVDAAGPFGGAKICTSSLGCVQQDGVRDILVTLDVTVGTPPGVSQGDNPTCNLSSGGIDKKITVTAGASTATLEVSFTPSDEEGNASGPTMTTTVPVPVGGPSESVTICASF